MKLPQFTLRDLFWLIVVIGMGIAWWVERRNLKAEIAQLVAQGPIHIVGEIDELDSARHLARIWMGSKDGLQEGQSFLILRGDMVLGRLVLVECQPEVSVGFIEKRHHSATIAKGDKITTHIFPSRDWPIRVPERADEGNYDLPNAMFR